jgi:O-antigen ligase
MTGEKVQRLAQYCDTSIQWGLILLLFLEPLIISPRSFDAFDLTKATLLYLFTLYLLVAYIARSIFLREWRFPKSITILPAFSFAVFAVISVVFSPVPFASIVGEYGRYETVQTLIAYIFLFFLALSYLNDEVWAKRALWALAAGGFLIALYAFIQKAGYEPIFPHFMIRPEQIVEGRARSTLGNAVFLGGYMALIAPVFLYAFLEFPSPFHLIFAFLFPLAVAANFFSLSRGGWLGMVGGLFFIVTYKVVSFFRLKGQIEGESFNSRRKNELYRGLVVLVALLIMISIFLFIIGKGNLVKPLKDIGKRFVSSFYFSQGTAATRFQIWKSSLFMIKDRPFTGWGPDQMLYQFPPYRTFKYTQLEGEMTMPDRCHNEYLQVAVNMGIFGFLSFLWFLTSFFFISLSHLRKKDGIYLGILAGLIAYFIQALTSITIIGIATCVFILMGILLNLSGEVEVVKRESSFLSQLGQLRFVFFFVFLVLSLFLAFLSVKPIIADYYFYTANRMIAEDEALYNWEAVENYYRSAVNWNPYREIYRTRLFDFYFNSARNYRSEEYLKAAISLAEDYISYNPYFQDILARAGSGYTFYFELTGNPNYLTIANEYFKKAKERDPYFRFARYRLIENYIRLGNTMQAISEAQSLINIWNDPWGYYYLGEVYRVRGNLVKAKEFYQKALLIDQGFVEAQKAYREVEKELQKSLEKGKK